MYFIALFISAWRERSCEVSIWPEIESQTEYDFFNDHTKTKDTNYRKLNLRKTKRVKKRVISKKLLGFVLVEHRLAVKFTGQRGNLTFVGEHGKWNMEQGTWNMVTKSNCRQEQKLNRTRYFRSDVKTVQGSLRK